MVNGENWTNNQAWIEYVTQKLEEQCPNLSVSNYRITSPDTDIYNCVAWAAEDNENWWWPDPLEQEYWPAGVPRERTLNAFIKAYETLSYVVCQDEALELKWQKIAIYINDVGEPAHVARQLRNGKWTSKIGSSEDIEHENLEAILCQLYPKIACFMKRPTN